jgi:tetratricopeptide (TPR) repeat protein
MGILERLTSIFKRKEKKLSEDELRDLNAYRALEYGKEHFLAKHYRDALECFDKAVEFGMEKEATGHRAICLQSLGHDLDAIEDFDTAIGFTPDDCNLFFMRGLSKSATGDFRGALEDFAAATRLSQLDTPLNRVYLQGTREMGRNNIADLFTLHIVSAKLSVNEKWLIEEKVKAAQKTRRPKRIAKQSQLVMLWEPPPVSD